PKVWSAFLDSTHFTRVVVLEGGNTGWHKIQSVFSWVRMWGGSIPLAYAIQGAVTAALAAALFWLWRSRASFALQSAALCVAVIAATPYSLDYDMMVLAPAIAFLAADGMSRGFDAYEKSALAGLWLMPLIARSVAQHTLIPLGSIVMLAALALTFRRAWRQNGLGEFKAAAENVAA
ncbi:MAG: glycosyltransferase 87 family protein, partial [Pseudomonadota bacterium]|nr:glycosyltransferase 87 family protein [Pseudomonadota bacterium]